MRTGSRLTGFVVALALSTPVPARAQLQLTRVLTNPSPASGSELLSPQRFGFSVAWVGDRPLVGTPGLDRSLPNGTLFADAGAAYLFDPETGVLLTTFLPRLLHIGQAGHAVSAVAGQPLVGAPTAEYSGVGRAYLFDAASATQLVEFLPIGVPGASTPGARVGFAVGSTCGAVLVGAPFAGVTLLHAPDREEPIGTLRPPAPQTNDLFGTAVTTLGDLVLVGAPGTQSNRGAVLLFDGATGTALGTVTPFGGSAPDQEFGAAVAVTGDAMIVGAPGSSGDRGGVQVFGPDGTPLERLPDFAELVPPGARFGSTVAGLGRRVLAGAPGAVEAWALDPQQGLAPLFSGLPGAGAVYVHDLEGRLLQTLVSPVPTAGEQFGASIAVSGRRVLVGAPGADGGRGAVYLFEQPAADAPVASDQTVAGTEDTPVSIALQASDPTAGGLTYTILCPPQHGVLSGVPPLLTYIPDPQYSGPDAFTYRVANALADSMVATVSITVLPVNDAPTASDQSIAVAAGASASVSLTGADPEGNALSFRIVTLPARGTLSGTPPRVLYTPAPGFTGLDAFTFAASDGKLSSAPGTITIRVLPGLAIADATVVEPDSGTVAAAFTVSLSPASAAMVAVPFTTANGTALAGPDYGVTRGTLTFPPGVTIQRVVVAVVGDRLHEPTESFRVDLGTPTGALVTRGQAVGTILDNDPMIGTSALEPASIVVAPGELVTLTLTWTHPTRWRDLRTLDLRVRDGRHVALWVRLHEADRTLSLVRAGHHAIGRRVAPGGRGQLETSTAVVDLRESRAFDDGPGGPTLGVTLRVAFKPRAAGRTYQVEAFATDDAGTQQGFDRVGSLTILPKPRHRSHPR